MRPGHLSQGARPADPPAHHRRIRSRDSRVRQHVRDARLRRLDEQLARVRRLYEYGEYDWDTFLAKRAEIHDAQQSLRNEASVTQQDGDVDWCRAQLLDLVAAWDAADDAQRSRLLSALFESIDAEALPQRGLRLVAAPRGAWRGFFQSLVLERETGLEPATSTLGRCRSVSEFARDR
jgi:hypothetical protein